MQPSIIIFIFNWLPHGKKGHYAWHSPTHSRTWKNKKFLSQWGI